MVGRFVEQQQVGLLPGDQRQGQRAFSPPEKFTTTSSQRAAEVETAEEVAQGLLALARGDALQVQQRLALASGESSWCWAK